MIYCSNWSIFVGILSSYRPESLRRILEKNGKQHHFSMVDGERILLNSFEGRRHRCWGPVAGVQYVDQRVDQGVKVGHSFEE
jgi:hypothetical protein